jgi:antitoxin (DNA-binding transcriptional repressor) of toxin-antitoxin stability system
MLCGVGAGHAYEVPVGRPAIDGALAEVEAGEIAYLTRAGERVAALVPLPHLEEIWDASDDSAIWKKISNRR